MTTTKRLTKNDILFIEEYFQNGFNGCRAYQTIFNSTDRFSAKASAYRLLSKSHIKKEIDMRFKEIQEAAITRREIISINLNELMLQNLPDQMNSDPIILLKTIDMINKLNGNYIEKIDANITQSINLVIPGMDNIEISKEEEEEEED